MSKKETKKFGLQHRRDDNVEDVIRVSYPKRISFANNFVVEPKQELTRSYYWDTNGKIQCVNL